MKKEIILFPVFLLLFSFLFAQDNQDGDIKKKIKEKSRSDKDRIVLEMTFDNWLTKPDSIKTEWHSRGVGLYWMFADIQLGKSNFSFSFGAGITASNIYHNAMLQETDSMTYFIISPSLQASIYSGYKRNKMVTAYLDAPIELRYRSNPDRSNNSWKVSIGFKGGMLIGSHIKVKSKHPVLNDLTVYKESYIKHLNKYRYGPTIKLGYGTFNIIAYYSLSTLFDKNKGPEIVPFSVGILLSEF